MFNLASLVQKAQSFIDPTQALNISPSDRNPAKSTLFRNQFRLPDTQTPLQEITAELTISPPVAVSRIVIPLYNSPVEVVEFSREGMRLTMF